MLQSYFCDPAASGIVSIVSHGITSSDRATVLAMK